MMRAMVILNLVCLEILAVAQHKGGWDWFDGAAIAVTGLCVVVASVAVWKWKGLQ